jgi:DNA-binding NtrC family response regulator
MTGPGLVFGTLFARYLWDGVTMVAQWSQVGDVNVLASAADWAWPDAMRNIFKPRGVNLLMAEKAGEFVNIIATTRIHTAIVDVDSDRSNGLATIKILRMDYPLVPCIVLTRQVDKEMLGKALQLQAFSVVGKPVNMDILRQLLNRLFLKRYNSDLFAR